MSTKKNLNLLAKAGKHTAIKQTSYVSRFFGHQPKVPARLLEKKDK